jgi:hypothetical protein
MSRGIFVREDGIIKAMNRESAPSSAVECRLACRAVLWCLSALLAVVATACTGSSESSSSRSASPTPSFALSTPVSAAGLTIDVPANWRRLDAKSCLDTKGPAIIVGAFSELNGCPITTTATIAVLGFGGPPFPPIPTAHERDLTVHGIAVQVLTGSDPILHQSELLALFPDAHAWLHVVAPGANERVSLADASRLVQTVRTTFGVPALKPRLIRESFIGRWYVHGAGLDIRSNRLGILTDGHGCKNDCEESYYLALSPSRAGRMTAIVKRITYSDPVSGRPVESPNTSTTPRVGDVYRVGDAFSLQFVEPQLMLSVTIRASLAATKDSDIGNPYWCGPHLAAKFGAACGA